MIVITSRDNLTETLIGLGHASPVALRGPALDLFLERQQAVAATIFDDVRKWECVGVPRLRGFGAPRNAISFGMLLARDWYLRPIEEPTA